MRRSDLPLLLWVFIAFLVGGWGVVYAGETVRVAVISDLNGSYGSAAYSSRVRAAVDRIIELGPDLVICTGGMVAGQRRNPRLNRQELGVMWAAFNKVVTKPLTKAGIPLAITPGNHDASAFETFQAEREAFDRQWRSRRPELHFVNTTNYPYQYAFSVGPVLFMAVEATVPGPLPESRRLWLQRVLAEHGPSYRHRIVFTHLSLWPVSQGREAEVLGDRELEALLAAHDVGTVLSGHNHAFYPGAKEGVLYLSQSSLAGGTLRLIGTDAATPHSFTVLEISDEHLEYRALVAPTYTTAVDLEQLPAELRTPMATLFRADLADSTD